MSKRTFYIILYVEFIQDCIEEDLMEDQRESVEFKV